MPFNRMRHVVVIDQSIDDRVRAATDCGSRAAARDVAFAIVRDGGDDFCSVTASIAAQTVNRRSRIAFVAAAARRDRSKARQPRCGEGALVVAGRRLVVAVFKPGRCEWCATAVSSPLQTRSLRGLRKPMRGTQRCTVDFGIHHAVTFVSSSSK